jgi:5-methylcytosine-specific restriction endonuclease McrA
VPGAAGAATLSREPRLHTNHQRRHAVAERDGWFCAYCDVELVCWCQIPVVGGSRTEPPTKRFATLEHIDSSSGRGRNRLSNLALACQSCNSKKGTRHVSVMDR